MTVSMAFGTGDDPLWMLGNIAAVAVIGVMIYFGYKWMNKGGKDGGAKIKVPKM
tara:strand:- start:625 stop:786 length:162 start_codon:yes stop_codon:yes gene_type:complete